MNTHEGDQNRSGPAGPDKPDLSEAIAEAFVLAVALIDAGWQLRTFGYRADSATGTVHAETPSGRVVTVSCTTDGTTWAQQVPEDSDTVGLARQIAELGARDQQSGGDNLDHLRLIVQHRAGRRPRLPRSAWWRSDELPTLPADEQPRQAARAAAWLIAYLSVECEWTIGHFGEDVAAGGFIAATPGGTLAVYPRPTRAHRMRDDGTPATMLALMIARLNASELMLLQHLDYRLLYAAGRGAAS